MFNILLIVIGVVVGLVVFDAHRHHVLFKMGLRNIFRRKTNTVIVILGLMIGTAIISSSLGVGDTMDNMVEGETFKSWQETDITVYNTTAQGEYVPISSRTYGNLSGEMKQIDNVEGVSGEVHGSGSMFSPSSRLSESNVKMIGMDLEESHGFKPFYKDGKELQPSLKPGQIYIDGPLSDDLEADKGDDIILFTKSFPRGRRYEIKDVLDNKGRAAFGGSGKVIMSLQQGQEALDIQNGINYIRITAEGNVEEGLKHCDQIEKDTEEILRSDPSYNVLEVQGNKKTDLEEFKQGISQFSDLFLVFGTFAIVAGIILTINIFVMLGEERKSEMGMSRAIGMKRSHLRRVFSYEGLFYSLGASILGTFVGIGLTYIIFYFLEDIFSIFGGDMSLLAYFDYTGNSILLAFSAGFLLTMGTIFFSVTRISKLNIVRAIREIPDPPVSRKSKKIFYLALAGLALGALMFIIGLNVEQLWLPVTGTSLMIIGVGTVVRRWVGDRIAYSGVGIFLLIWWLMPLPFFEGYSNNIEMFILSGLFVVTAGVLLVILNGYFITGCLERCAGSGRGFKAVVLSAVSHPLKEKFRTAMTIFIFALIIFAITVMGVMVGMFNTNIDRMIEEQSGGYEIIGVCDTNRPINNITAEIERSDNLTLDDFDQVDSAVRGMVPSNRTVEGQRMRQSVIGIDSNFVKNNSFGFSDYMSQYDSKEEVWQAVLSDPSLVVSQSSTMQFGPPTGDRTSLNSTVTLFDKNGELVEKRVIGLMNQSVIQGLFMSKDTAEDEFDMTSNSLFFMNVKEGRDADKIAKDLEREFIENGMQPIVLGTIIEQSLSATWMFFDLFSGYMGLGLVVGIAGLGIISLRAVHERRLEIGMMRAIGFKRRMISYAFLIENSFITLTGIILGTVLGIAIGWSLWNSQFAPMGWEFAIPWSRILIIGIIAYVTMFLTAIPSAQKASRVAPAEALRFD